MTDADATDDMSEPGEVGDVRRPQQGEHRPLRTGEHPDRVIARLARRQHGVVARRQLLAQGLTAGMVDTRVACGRLVRRHRGVYVAGQAPLGRAGRWTAGVLAAGPGAVLSHRSAAGLHGIRPASGPVEVTRGTSTPGPPGICTHRTRRVDPADRTTVDGIPVTTVARTLADLAAVVPADHLAKALSEADRLRLLDMRALEDAVRRIARHPSGCHAALTAALADLRAIGGAAASPLEDAFLRLVRDAGLPPPRPNARILGMEVDAVWTEQRLVVELDGWSYHRSRRAFERDRDRDRRLAIAGYRTVRFTHAGITRRPREVVETLVTLLDVLGRPGPR